MTLSQMKDWQSGRLASSQSLPPPASRKGEHALLDGDCLCRAGSGILINYSTDPIPCPGFLLLIFIRELPKNACPKRALPHLKGLPHLGLSKSRRGTKKGRMKLIRGPRLVMEACTPFAGMRTGMGLDSKVWPGVRGSWGEGGERGAERKCWLP